jgi:hypothetical protein
MENTTNRKPKNTSKRLTRAEKATLDRLKGLRAASRQANHAYNNLFHYHRGTYLIRRTCVVYGNDGFHSDGVRSQREAVRVAQRVEARGYQIEGFGVSDGGYSWAIVIRFDPRTNRTEKECADWRLNSMVWDVWCEIAGQGPDFASKVAVERGRGEQRGV